MDQLIAETAIRAYDYGARHVAQPPVENSPTPAVLAVQRGKLTLEQGKAFLTWFLKSSTFKTIDEWMCADTAAEVDAAA